MLTLVVLGLTMSGTSSVPNLRARSSVPLGLFPRSIGAEQVHAFHVKAVFCESIAVRRPWEVREPRAEIHRKSRMREADTTGLMSGDGNVAISLMKRHRLRS